MKYKAYFKEEKKVHTSVPSEIQHYLYQGYSLDINSYTLTRPAKMKIFQIDTEGQIKEANPYKFICEFYKKTIIARKDLELLIRDLKAGKVRFDDIIHLANKS